jgi:hypothetical protein
VVGEADDGIRETAAGGRASCEGRKPLNTVSSRDTEMYRTALMFDPNADYVVYGFGLDYELGASSCVWMIPGTWIDED